MHLAEGYLGLYALELRSRSRPEWCVNDVFIELHGAQALGRENLHMNIYTREQEKGFMPAEATLHQALSSTASPPDSTHCFP